MKKSTWIKLAAVGVQATPPVVVLLLNAPVFIERTDKAISAAAILVAVILALIFRDATKKIFQTPSAFKTCLFCFLFSLIAVSLGSQMLQISATALISGACAIPLNMWHNNETKPATTDDIVKALEGMVKESTNESNNKNS
jgi:hypothetical protein